VGQGVKVEIYRFILLHHGGSYALFLLHWSYPWGSEFRPLEAVQGEESPEEGFPVFFICMSLSLAWNMRILRLWFVCFCFQEGGLCSGWRVGVIYYGRGRKGERKRRNQSYPVPRGLTWESLPKFVNTNAGGGTSAMRKMLINFNANRPGKSISNLEVSDSASRGTEPGFSPAPGFLKLWVVLPFLLEKENTGGEVKAWGIYPPIPKKEAFGGTFSSSVRGETYHFIKGRGRLRKIPLLQKDVSPLWG